ncbi:MAG: undecaprenyldiphospho-muramoylpentapeptide beta-N-acetylglucosaminyltransferase [Bacteroidota bacterium]|jgi:UDP-N-acetylglucosamine--N-acetylmuramyl-(pentapeptide) pyrophosphoryl-undecaprenol N-acetylglucosamine transferase
MSLQRPKIKVIISGGGTGGHIFPAIAIAQALLRLNPQNELLFVGANGRMEMEKVPAAGFRIVGLDIAGLQRRFAFSNLLLPFKVIGSLLKARSIVREFRPDVAVGVGGYASGPLLFAASGMNVPTLIQEQNSFAGVTNRILSRRAERICVAYSGMEKYFPTDKTTLTGNPVRADLKDIEGKREEGLVYFGLADRKPVVLVIGGSLGARTINRAILAGKDKFEREGVQVLWQTGKGGADYASYSDHSLKVLPFIQRMDLAYAVADVVVSRAGASSVSELALAKKAAILVPSPNVAEDHQTKNAMALVGKDAALLVEDRSAETELVDRVLELLRDLPKRQDLSRKIAGFGMPDAADVIAGEIYKLSGK